MKSTPFVNALAAAVYIVVVAFVLNTLSSFSFPRGTILVPMFILSLFVLSAGVMGFLFLFQPFRLYFEDHKREATLFFLRTLGFFSCFVLVFLAALLYALPR